MLDIFKLNSDQRTAVITTEGPVLVLAGAGSGKTKVLTYRIAFILDTGLAREDNILAVTFTNKAAREMKERAINIINSESKVNIFDLPWMGTFHSVCLKILKINSSHIGFEKNFTVYDSNDSENIVKKAMEELQISIKEFSPKAIKSYISSAKNERIDPEKYQNYASGYFQNIVAQVYPRYQSILKQNNGMDFDDLLLKTCELFEKEKKILEKYQDKFKYILVDEYQDTNHVQYYLIKLLAEKHNNICCVGDDDQGIYSFRGATVQNILTFEKDYSNFKLVKLEQNYRSTKNILELAHQVITKNKNRRDKKMWTDNREGEKITLYKAYDQVDEGNFVVDIIKNNYLGELSETAILYRTNAQSRAMEEVLIGSGIPYKIIGGLRFYDRKEIKDLIAYIKLIYNPKDANSFERIYNVPKRGIGEKALDEIKNIAKEKKIELFEAIINEEIKLENQKLRILRDLFLDLLNKSFKFNIEEILNLILEKTKYVDHLKDGTLESEARIENIKELLSVTREFVEIYPENNVEAFLDEISLLEINSSKNEKEECVTLMTVHASKGLEFKNVFIIGMEENLFPHSNSSIDQKDLEEERRLSYVAITRAKEKLYITHAEARLYFGNFQRNSISRFLKGIDYKNFEKKQSSILEETNMLNLDEVGYNNNYEKINLKIGDFVKHEYFGKGKIQKINEDIVVIDFGNIYGKKELYLEYANLKKI